MAVRHSVNVRNALLDAYETAIGASPKLRIYTGAPPALITTAPTGTLLVELALPADWMGAAVNGQKDILGAWTGTAIAAGTAGYYRIVNTAGTINHEDGTISMPAGGGDTIMNNTNIAVGQVITVPAFTKTKA